MTSGWDALDAELELWAAQGLTLPLWWRDDDAIAPTEALTRLEALAQHLGLPVHLAVIPRHATGELADHIRKSTHLIPVVHGWAHENHAPADKKTCEFGSTREVDAALDEAEAGLTRLKQLFGAQLQPMFVPPWNRISPALVPWLAGLDYTGLSAFGPRKKPNAAPGLLQVNTHIDPIDWKGSRSLREEDQILATLLARLTARRLGTEDRAEPLGYLTHHLVQDAAIWAFSERLLSRLLAGPATPWRYDKRTT